MLRRAEQHSSASDAAKPEGRIGERFAALRARGERALVPFLTAGDPDLETTEALVLAMAEAGADVIELGVPFSDPTAEGPTIQRSSSRALARGTSLRSILRLVDRLRARVEQPLVLMGYANPIHAMGGKPSPGPPRRSVSTASSSRTSRPKMAGPGSIPVARWASIRSCSPPRRRRRRGSRCWCGRRAASSMRSRCRA